jgi:hypothetical protein
MIESNSDRITPQASPLRSLIGSMISGAIAVGLYFFTVSVARKLALHPFVRAETLADRIGAGVRTILLAMGSSITMIFGVIAIGLVLLAGKQIIEKLRPERSPVK